MQPRPEDSQSMLFTSKLEQILNDQHPLCRLADTIEWSEFEKAFGKLYDPGFGRPAINTRLMVGLHYLKYAFNLSDGSAVEQWIENPYWQYFCGEQYFQHQFPIDPSSMTRWRNRLKADGMEKLLEETIKTGLKSGVLKQHQFKKLTVDTTVQEKAISFPTDAKLYHKMRVKLVNKAKQYGINIRQSYDRVGKRSFVMQHRYAHARQMKRSRRELRKLRTYLGRVTRDIERKLIQMPDRINKEFCGLIDISHRLLSQQKDSHNKIYSIHEPLVSCISKGKTHKKYEFGCKVGLVSPIGNAFVVGAVAFEGNPYDGHTLYDSLIQSKRLLNRENDFEDVYVDDGYKSHGCEELADVHIVKKGWRKLSRSIRKWFGKRSMIEPVIGHCKSDNRLDRNHLKGTDGDKVNAILSACGFNIHKLLRKIIFWLVRIIQKLLLLPEETLMPYPACC